MITIRFVKYGEAPKNVLCEFDATAGEVFAQATGSGSPPGDMKLSVNGLAASPTTPVRAGDTVALSPQADNG